MKHSRSEGRTLALRVSEESAPPPPLSLFRAVERPTESNGAVKNDTPLPSTVGSRVELGGGQIRLAEARNVRLGVRGHRVCATHQVAKLILLHLPNRSDRRGRCCVGRWGLVEAWRRGEKVSVGFYFCPPTTAGLCGAPWGRPLTLTVAMTGDYDRAHDGVGVCVARHGPEQVGNGAREARGRAKLPA